MAKTYLFWEPLSDNILQERDESEALVAEYTTEPGLYGNVISQNRGGVESQFHYDALGSTLALTDDNQQVTDTRAYSTFGESTEVSGGTVFPFQYVGCFGYYRDSASGDYFVRRRQYKADIDRWLSADPHRAATGTTRYSLDPRHVDPSGLKALPLSELKDKRATGKCGASEVLLSVKLDKTTGFPANAPCTGILLQRVKLLEDIVSCPCKDCPKLTPETVNDCYEWLGTIAKGKAQTGPETRTGAADTRKTNSAGVDTCGSSASRGEMRFYCIEAADVQKLLPELLAWKVGKDVGCPTGTAKASKKAPEIWKRDADYSATADVSVSWNCCKGMEKDTVIDVSIASSK